MIRNAVPENVRTGLQDAVLQRINGGLPGTGAQLPVQRDPTGRVTAFADDLDRVDWSPYCD